MDCYACVTCRAVYKTYSRFCVRCKGEKTLELDQYGLTRRLLINILGTIPQEELQDMANITGYGPVTHEALFQEIAEAMK